MALTKEELAWLDADYMASAEQRAEQAQRYAEMLNRAAKRDLELTCAELEERFKKLVRKSR